MSEERNNNDVATEQEEKEIKFDFTDPDALIKELESVELTEEDTEDLLIEAYRMNMMLKEALRAQEASKHRKKKNNVVSSGRPLQCTRNANRSHRRSPGSTLPPIHRSETTLVTRNHTKQPEIPSRVPRSNSKSKSSGSSSRKSTRSAADRPVWDDRFSFA